MNKVIGFFKDFFEAMALRDKVLMFSYLVIFVPLGLLMEYKVIPYPETVADWFTDIAKDGDQFYWYIGTFVAIQAANLTTLIAAIKFDDGLVPLLKYKHQYFENDWMGVVTSITVIVIALMVNFLLFPIFLPVYIVIGLIWAFTSNNNSR